VGLGLVDRSQRQLKATKERAERIYRDRARLSHRPRYANGVVSVQRHTAAPWWSRLALQKGVGGSIASLEQCHSSESKDFMVTFPASITNALDKANGSHASYYLSEDREGKAPRFSAELGCSRRTEDCGALETLMQRCAASPPQVLRTKGCRGDCGGNAPSANDSKFENSAQSRARARALVAGTCGHGQTLLVARSSLAWANARSQDRWSNYQNTVAAKV